MMLSRHCMEKRFRTKVLPLPGDAWFPEGLLYVAETPYGKVIVGGEGDSIYPAGDAFLIVDLGGNDLYRFDESLHPIERGGRIVPCATIIDLGGCGSL